MGVNSHNQQVSGEGLARMHQVAESDRLPLRFNEPQGQVGRDVASERP